MALSANAATLTQNADTLKQLVDSKVDGMFLDLERFYDEASIMTAVVAALRRRDSLPAYRHSSNFSVIKHL